ncbi:hypothetical protein IWW36_003165 [Coemansia brasiliensis]|uniref:COPI associated n=1 Tax=Coemansia brasiliensis TaxID=2650707 RepID=A0A9W8LYT5_9FUNG|nr:hypothetical protein IWW36_003165 [Coemansia brasiliensis]
MTLPYILARRPLHFSRPLSPILLVLNFILGALVFTQGCLSIVNGDVRHIMLGIMCLFFGLFVMLTEFVHIAALRMYASFLFSFCGRGLFYLVVGCITVDAGVAELGIGLVLVIMAVIFLGVALSPQMQFDDPEDPYASVIRNVQQGTYLHGQKPHLGAASASKTMPTMGSYIPQGISSSTFNISGSIAPDGHISDKPPRL